MTKIFSLIFFHDDINFYCLVRPKIESDAVEYHVTVRYVDFGLGLQEEYFVREENGKILEEETDSTIKKYMIQALKQHLYKNRHADSTDH